MAYENAPVDRSDKDGAKRNTHQSYNEELDKVKAARNNTLGDTDPMIPYEGFYGIDERDKERRRKIR